MRKWWRLAGLLALIAAGPLCAEPVFPPGLRIGMEPPAGMKLNPTTGAIEDGDRQALIGIFDLPAAAYASVENQVFNEELKKPGVTVDKRETFEFHDGIGFLVTFRVTTEGRLRHRWFFIAASAVNPVFDLATLVTVEVPDEAKDRYPESAIRAALASVRFRPTPIQEQVGLLPFELSNLAGLRVVKVFGRAGVLLTQGPEDREQTLQPKILISVGQGRVADSERGAAATRLLSAGTPVQDVRVTVSEPMRIGGQPGYEIRGEGRDGPIGTPVSLVQWIRFGSNGFVRMLAISRKEEWDEMFPKFRAIRDGVEPR